MAYSLRGSNLSHKKPDSNFGFVAYIMGVLYIGHKSFEDLWLF